MTRYPFGGQYQDFVTSPVDGSIAVGQPVKLYATVGTLNLTAWTAASGGTRITDLQDGAGNALAAISAANGVIPPFTGPDGVFQLWLDAGGGSRGLAVANNALNLVVALQRTVADLANTVASLSNNAIIPPTAPTITGVTAGNGTATVTYTPPANTGGAPITSYVVTASPGGLTGTAAGLTAVVSGLSNGTAYSFTVAAVNVAGTGASSSASASVTPVAPAVPVVTVTLGAVSSSTAAISWTTTNPGSVTGFLVSRDGVNTAGQSYSTTMSASATTASFSTLAAGSTYHLTVTPLTAAGNGTQGIVTAVTPAASAVLAGAPTGVTVTGGVAQASVSWTAPASNGGSAVTGYTVAWSGTAAGSQTFTSAATVQTITGLVAGPYTFTVAAINAVGTGPASATSTTTTVTAPAPSTTRTWLSGAADDGLAATRSAWQTSFGFYPQVWNTFNDFETDWASRASNISGNCGKCLPASSTGATVNVLTIGLILSSTTNGQAMNNAGLAAAASGSDTAFTPGWTSIANAINNAGHNAKSTVLRIGHEANGNWYPWSTNGDTTAMANYVTAWQKAVTAVRAVCPLVRFDMCYNSGSLGAASSASAIVTGHYAGDSYVDVIGLDYYDFQEAHTAATYTSNQGGLGFEQLAAFANTHGKKFALNEWGVNGDNDPNASTRDSPFYISTTFTTLQALQSQYPRIVDHDAYFNVNGNNAKFSVNPLSAAQYNTSFGNGAGTGTVAGGTAPATGAGSVTGITFTPGTTSVVINWTGATGTPDSYNLYVNHQYVTTVGSAVRTFTFGTGTPAANAALTAATAYTLGISGAVSGTNGPETDTSVTTTGTAPVAVPGTVTGVTFTETATTVTMNWTGSTGTPDSYNIFKGYTYVTTVGSGIRTYTFTGLTASTAYTLGIAGAISGTNGTETDTSVTTTA